MKAERALEGGHNQCVYVAGSPSGPADVVHLTMSYGSVSALRARMRSEAKFMHEQVPYLTYAVPSVSGLGNEAVATPNGVDARYGAWGIDVFYVNTRSGANPIRQSIGVARVVLDRVR